MINQNLLLAGDDAYNLSKSLRFRSSASAYLSRTPASAGNRRTFTWSGWVKIGLIDANYHSFFANGNAVDSMVFWNDNTLALTNFNGTSYLVRTTQVFRDPSAWYHLVIAFDTTQATASNRIKIYVNGSQVTNFATSTYPSQNYDTGYNTATIQYIAYNEYNRFEGYLAELNWIDGQALTPSSFGETDTITGVWKPKAFTGTYGTNGFYLPFTDVATTSGSNAGLGKDFSGNGNYWNTNNISVTAGSTYDSMSDVPTLTSATTANYAVFNPLWRLGGSGYITPTNGNLRASIGGTNNIIASTIPLPTTGKWYMEFTLTTAVYPEFGLCNNSANGGGGASNIFGMYMSLWFANGSNGSHDGNVPDTSGDIGLIAVDVDNNKLWIGRNRSGTVVWMGGGNPSSGTSPSFSASGGGGVYATTFNAQTFNNPFVASGAGSDVWDANFGQQPWVGTPPTGFVALNTFNLPEPSIKAGNKHFDVSLWTGNYPSTQTITNSGGFAPDFVWIKGRNYADNHTLWNTVAGAQKSLSSDTTTAETTRANALTAFTSTGFSLGVDTIVNPSSSYVVAGWQWKGGGTGSSNTAGSITSTVSVNATAGFSVVTYTGTGANATVGHGLGVAPKIMIVKRRDAVSAWDVYHASIGATGRLYLNTTDATNTSSAPWNDTAPTSSVFTVGTATDTNASGSTIVAYCWSEVAGFSKFGSYTGNGSTDGPFVYTGFRPKFVMIKNTTNGAADWVTWDSSRNTYNLTNAELNPNTSGAEVNYNTADFLSNGFKLRSTYGNTNGSGSTLIYMAFAESPFRYSIAR